VTSSFGSWIHAKTSCNAIIISILVNVYHYLVILLVHLHSQLYHSTDSSAHVLTPHKHEYSVVWRVNAYGISPLLAYRSYSPTAPTRLPILLAYCSYSPTAPPRLPLLLAFHSSSPTDPPRLPLLLAFHSSSPTAPPRLLLLLAFHSSSPTAPPRLPILFAYRSSSPTDPLRLPLHLAYRSSSPSTPPRLLLNLAYCSSRQTRLPFTRTRHSAYLVSVWAHTHCASLAMGSEPGFLPHGFTPCCPSTCSQTRERLRHQVIHNMVDVHNDQHASHLVYIAYMQTYRHINCQTIIIAVM
jgi:hypothetical protein